MKIAVVNTGGTISCVGKPLAPMTAKAFAAASTELLDPIMRQQFPDLQLSYVTDLTFPESTSGTLDSTNLQPSDWCLMAGYIIAHYADYDGWVVLHGTDSLAFTGTALPFLLSAFDANGIGTALLSKPVILTGSQVPMFHQATSTDPLSLNFNTDAFQNFCGAVAAAQTGIPEVCVYFDRTLFRGNRVVKTDAGKFAAFSSPNYPSLGGYGLEFTLNASQILPPPVSYAVSLDNPIVLAAVTAQLTAIAKSIDTAPVLQFNAFPAWYDASNSSAFLANLITACINQGAGGVILESYGAGNFPSGNPREPEKGAIYQALDAANKSNIVIMDNTQVLQGIVNNSAYAAGAWLPRVGALSPLDMTPAASFAKLTVLLAAQSHNSWRTADVKRLMQLSLLGEMLSISHLDSRGTATLLAGQSLTTPDGSATLQNHATRGLELTDSTGKCLWAPLASPAAADMPGRLMMQADGNLIFRGRNDQTLWSTNTGQANGGPSLLILDGSTADQTLSLRVYDYANRVVIRVLFGA